MQTSLLTPFSRVVKAAPSRVGHFANRYYLTSSAVHRDRSAGCGVPASSDEPLSGRRSALFGEREPLSGLVERNGLDRRQHAAALGQPGVGVSVQGDDRLDLKRVANHDRAAGPPDAARGMVRHGPGDATRPIRRKVRVSEARVVEITGATRASVAQRCGAAIGRMPWSHGRPCGMSRATDRLRLIQAAEVLGAAAR